MVCKLHDEINPPSPPFIKGGDTLNLLFPHSGGFAAAKKKGDTGGFSSEKGFTLVEVLVAVFILAVGLLSLAVLAGTVIKSNSTSNKVTIATTLAQDKMEEIRRLGYSGVAAGTTTQDYNSITNYSAYKRVTAITNDSPASGMKTVTVTVYWGTDAHSVVLKTILAE